MYFDDRIWIGSADDRKVCILPKMANRHGLIAGATGTGKTTTLKVIAESFSDAGVPVFLADIKGDLSGLCRPGEDSEDMQERIRRFGLEDTGFSYKDYPTAFWDIYGKEGISLRTTVSEMGPILLAKLMNLNDTQADILTCLFKMADDEELLLIDIKDLKAMLQYASENAAEISAKYGNVTKASVAAIIRGVVALEAAGGDQFFTEPGLNIMDFTKKSMDGRGTINVLDGRTLATDPTLYTAFLLYLMSELFETLPEVGDQAKPKLVFFFDEAHFLFTDMPNVFIQKIEQMVKLIRSKGVGVYFVTQNPADIPDSVLAQLSNKVQHALRAYTPAEQKAIKAAAQSYRVNPDFDTEQAITELGVGEAIVSFLDLEGIPTMVQKTKIICPQSKMAAAEETTRQSMMSQDGMNKYDSMIDNESAFEVLSEQARVSQEQARLDAEREAFEKEKAEYALAQQKEAEKAEKEAQKAAEKAHKEAVKAQERAEREALKAAEKEQKARARQASTAAGLVGGTLGREVGKALGSTFGSIGKKVGGNLGATLGRGFFKNLIGKK